MDRETLTVVNITGSRSVAALHTKAQNTAYTHREYTGPTRTIIVELVWSSCVYMAKCLLDILLLRRTF